MSEGARKQKKGDAVTLIVRAGLLALVVAVAIAIYLDSVARGNAVSTTNAWVEALDAANEQDKSLLSSELLPHVSGDPAVTGDLAQGEATFTWKSVIRSFSTKVTTEQAGEETTVVEINGPST